MITILIGPQAKPDSAVMLWVLKSSMTLQVSINNLNYIESTFIFDHLGPSGLVVPFLERIGYPEYRKAGQAAKVDVQGNQE